MGELKYRPPALLEPSHRLETFSCSNALLDTWLKRMARKNHSSGASRVFIVATEGGIVTGYYALAAGSVSRSVAPGHIRRNMPEPVPVVVLGRLAVHRDHEKCGLGAGMLKDAVTRAHHLAMDLGVRALLCHAMDESALRFYLHNGFLQSPLDPLTVMLPLNFHD